MNEKEKNNVRRVFTKRSSLYGVGLWGLILAGCSSGGDSNQTETFITEINSDLCLCDGGHYLIEGDIDDIRGSLTINGTSQLTVREATLTFELDDDLDYGIYLDDPIASEFAVYDNAIATVEDSDLMNTDILVGDEGALNLSNCTYDPDRVEVVEGATFQVEN